MNPRRAASLLVPLVVLLLLAGLVAVIDGDDGDSGRREDVSAAASLWPSTSTSVTSAATTTTLPPTTTTVPPPPPRQAWTMDPYRGLGAWIDVFDFDPAYSPGGVAAVGPAVIDDLARRGVRTLFLQGGRDDERTPGGLVPAELVGPMLARAHERGMSVVGWYLPLFRDVDFDLDIVRRMRAFEWEGHRYDGFALDIEANTTVADHATRTARLVELAARFRAEAPGDVIGAIVVPPVLLEVVNPGFWPGFPWAEMKPSFDVWLPMSYWSFRTVRSGYRDGYRYSIENVQRMFERLGGPVPLHLIGGVGDRTSDADFAPFLQAVDEAGSIGASFYDVRTTTEAGWAHLSGWAARNP